MNYGTKVTLLGKTFLTEPGGYSTILEEASDDYIESVSEAEALVEYAGRLCWNSEDKLGETKDRVQKWIGVGHESLLEHASMTFLIEGSRVFTHQLVRHRIASYSQRSQRFVKETEVSVIIPPQVGEHPELGPESAKLMEAIWAFYKKQLSYGVKADQARYVLPNATRTQIATTMNFRELRHFIRLRTSKKASGEMREIADQIRGICKEEAPSVFEDL
ncbi:hypothetical protein LCGC14_2196670 [marine sediment metagenome]|uniref:Thymidylate synthase (FAD) n=1 Tax=marine sediment metagenome TaxID=412755 RepID=A0A0F9DI54_9ZZZZ